MSLVNVTVRSEVNTLVHSKVLCQQAIENLFVFYIILAVLTNININATTALSKVITRMHRRWDRSTCLCRLLIQLRIKECRPPERGNFENLLDGTKNGSPEEESHL
jgi:hypothetical protein